MSRTSLRHPIERGRRAFLRGAWRHGPRRNEPWRPPWARPDFEDACIRCGTCEDACPQQILAADEVGFPEVDLRRGAGSCTFCRACVDACPEPAFVDPDEHAPWHRVAELGERCLARHGVHCQTCGDACDWEAIRFVPCLGGPPQPRLDADACAGCGACASVCPAETITILPGRGVVAESTRR